MSEAVGRAAPTARRPTGAGAPPREAPGSLFGEVTSLLSKTPKRLPAKLLYDERGARLFEEITRTDAYYPTRTEVGILRACLPEVAGIAGPHASVVEFGTGDGRKTEMLLRALDHPSACIPIDISERQLLGFADELRDRFPELEVLPVTADYTRPFELPSPGRGPSGRVLVFFPGSTIGNLEPADAERFLATARASTTRPDGSPPLLLIGVDLTKPVSVLLRAYDDPEGITARFNRNALAHLNTLFDGDAPVSEFEHRAIWNAERSRMEMHLVCDDPHRITLRDPASVRSPFQFRLARGEPIVTEHSYKYGPHTFEALCVDAGWTTLRRWTDPRGWFAVVALEARRS